MEYFQTICRICESQDNLCDLTNKLNENVAAKLSSLTTIRIQQDDTLPRCICMECVGTLNLSYDFLLRCEAAEQKLQEEIQELLKAEVSVDTGEQKPLIETIEFLVGENVDIEDLVGRSSPDQQELDVLKVENHVELAETEQLFKAQSEGFAIEEILEEEDDINMVEGELIDNGEATDVICQDQEHTRNFIPMQTTSMDGTKKFFCETCGKGFEKCTDLYKHNKDHGKERFQCKQCDRWFSRRAHLQSHEVIHTGERNYACQSCTNSYTSSRNLRRHVKSAHLGEKPFVCDLCGKEFSQKTILEAHHSTHVQEKNYCCPVCAKRFKSGKLLKLHETRHTRSVQVKTSVDAVECDVCHKVYSSKISLRSHKQMHSDAKILCTFCGKSFKVRAHLKVHLRSHTKEQPYECGVCHKKFGYETSLRTHRLIHSGERPYKCDMCELSFKQVNHLKAHKFLHSGQKPFECLVCRKSFALRGNLTIHMRIHDEQACSPFQCYLCEGKKLNDSNALKRHLKAHPLAKVVKMGTLTVILDAEQELKTEESTEAEQLVLEAGQDEDSQS
ncbi:gastrula zinc finger protein XlCGF57.1-like [Wyeomyia smithii]|uniref:gastrula zinc finger protein XlCGF57.1-like n=1 Tax=Wyeomyia smithii TaxID=174621 RepID=UPI002467F117|nr:gastrula zinc finger protein XlCGF57.1-like [Wyeomyia smithii]